MRRAGTSSANRLYLCASEVLKPQPGYRSYEERVNGKRGDSLGIRRESRNIGAFTAEIEGTMGPEKTKTQTEIFEDERKDTFLGQIEEEDLEDDDEGFEGQDEDE